MKKLFPVILFVVCCLLLASCSTDTPQNYFDRAVLNSNTLVGFADEWHLRQMETPGIKLNEKGETVSVKRIEDVVQKIQFMEEDKGKLKALKETEETKEMLQTSAALYDYILPVYKNEYTKLAELYDSNAPKAATDSLAKKIHDSYYTEYEAIYNKLISIGKVYAQKHSIKVNWAM